MIIRRPGFFDDVARFGFGGAWTKRNSSLQVGGYSYSYGQMLALPWQHKQSLLSAAIAARNITAACWIFEAIMLECRGNFQHCWQATMAVLVQHHESLALPVLDRFIAYLPAKEILQTLQLSAYGNFLVGKVLSDKAHRAKGSNKTELQSSKKLAMHFLGVARQQVDHERRVPAADPYRQAALAAALAASVAAAYEAAAYLQWKGTRTTALSE